MAKVVYTTVADATGIQGSLFQGAKVWLSQRVPQRRRFIEEVEANGGLITPLEKEAAIKIVDHARKEQLPGTYSYKYIEDSVRNGALQDLDQYVVGPPIGTIRTVGSIVQPAKSGRTKFSTEDDQALVNWVIGVEQRGGSTNGNEIYKQLEAQNPRHTWQSWRDRWVKKLKDLPRSASVSKGAPPTPPADHVIETNGFPTSTDKSNVGRKSFTREDMEKLLCAGSDIEEILPENIKVAWSEWARCQDRPEDHSADDWQNLWERKIRPLYLKEHAEGAANAEKDSQDRTEEQEQAELPVRISPLNKNIKEPVFVRSPSYHPESPSRQVHFSSRERSIPAPAGHDMDGLSDAKYGANLPAKRKRPAVEDLEELPSSTPPRPIASPKRLCIRDEVPLSSPPGPSIPTRDLGHGTPLAEVSPTPEKGPLTLPRGETPDTYAAEHKDFREVIEITDDDKESQSVDEEDYYSEASHSLSPELGGSPRESFTYLDGNGSKTQAAFEEPTPSIEYEVPPPEGGWPDDGDDGSSDEESSDDEEASDAVDEDTEYIEIDDEEGECEDQDEDDQHDVLDIESSRNTNDAEIVKKMGIDASSSSLSCEPQAPAIYQPTTQALLSNKTQEPDFTLAEPEGGWDQVLPFSVTHTQEPDLSLAEPEGGWDPALQPSSPHTLPASAQPDIPPLPEEQIQPRNAPPIDFGDQVDDFIAHQIALGHDDDAIIVALRCTSLDRALAASIVGYIETHDGEIPPQMKGCWTEEDDGILEGVQRRRIKALEEKHGFGSLETRWRFLEEWRREE
ncbi:MAG: hypothetical protein Q9182_005415 [Xanthomendoza sp. 2 TL-2023]